MELLTCILFTVTVFLCIKTSESIEKKHTFDIPLCETEFCVPKCCKQGYYLIGMKKNCKKNDTVSVDFRLDFSEVPIYFNNLTRTERYMNKMKIIPGRLLDENFRDNSYDFGFADRRPNFYLTEKGILYSEIPNVYDRWTKYNSSQFCADYTLPMPKFKIYKPEVRFITVFQNNDEGRSEGETAAMTYSLLISVFFMVLVLLVYAVLPELRNLSGKVLMAYVFSLMSAFTLLFALDFSENINHSKGLSISIYYMFLASFCWMNVMSYDIWWTFRGYAKACPIHRRGENFKFGMYCIYSWGLPAALTVIVIVIEETDLRHMPWILKPNINTNSRFFGAMEKFFYLYIPMLILISCNWIFFLMTAFNIWRIHRATLILDSAAADVPAAHRKQKYRLAIYLKLSIIMGINWILEVVSSFHPNFQGWYISDIYNILIGLSIFLIFVCKKKIYRKLKKRLSGDNLWKSSHSRTSKRSRSSNSNTSKSDVSQEMTISSNPKGVFNTNKQCEIRTPESKL